jgi:excisionase family DNA binding protein
MGVSATIWPDMATSEHTPALVSLAVAAEYLGVTVQTLRRDIKRANPLGAVKVGGTWRVRRDVLESLGRQPK